MDAAVAPPAAADIARAIERACATGLSSPAPLIDCAPRGHQIVKERMPRSRATKLRQPLRRDERPNVAHQPREPRESLALAEPRAAKRRLDALVRRAHLGGALFRSYLCVNKTQQIVILGQLLF
jgi:hypothetical protein